MSKRIFITGKEFEILTEPPRQFLQVVKYKGINPKAKRFRSIFWEGYDMRETALVIGNSVVFFRVYYPSRLLDIIEEIRRPLRRRWRFVEEMWYRKTFRVTEEQVNQRLHERALKAITISIIPKD